MNYLMLSAGRRGELLKDFRQSITASSKLIATDLSPYAPALYMADKQYLVPRIDAPDYIEKILDICRMAQINAVTTFIDSEIEILAENRDKFEKIGVEARAPYKETSRICFDKYLMFQYLKKHGLPTVMTWETLEELDRALKINAVHFPVFVKPRTGSGSVGARKICSYELLKEAIKEDKSLIIQKYMNCIDMDADVYIDTITHEAVSAFLKKKIEIRIWGASKTISFKDNRLFGFAQKICSVLKFNGPVDMDFFFRDGQYYLSEVNPRFGGGYIHAYGAGVDFIQLIENNLRGEANTPRFGDYEENIVMMMYDSVVIKRQKDMI